MRAVRDQIKCQPDSARSRADMMPAPVPAKCFPAKKIKGTASVPSRAGTTRYATSASSPTCRATMAESQVIGRALRYGMPDGMAAPCPSASERAAYDVVSSSPKNPRSPRPEKRTVAATTVIRITAIQTAYRLRDSVMRAHLALSLSQYPPVFTDSNHRSAYNDCHLLMGFHCKSAPACTSCGSPNVKYRAMSGAASRLPFHLRQVPLQLIRSRLVSQIVVRSLPLAGLHD